MIEIKRSAPEALAFAKQLLDADSSPYRWIAFESGTEDRATAAALVSQAPLFRADSAGRIGVIEIVKMAGDSLGANVRIAAERFPNPAYDMARKFVETHEAQIQFPG